MVLVSKCCAGIPCRYKANGYLRGFLQKVGLEHDFIAVCPEQLGGLPTPRNPSERRGDLVVMSDGRDVTAEYRRGAEETLRLARLYGCTAAVLKEKSPSCGSSLIYDGSFTGTLRPGVGVTAALLLRNGITVRDEQSCAETGNKAK